MSLQKIDTEHENYCKCDCPFGNCNHEWNDENLDAICQICNITWQKHKNLITERCIFWEEILFEEKRKYF